MAEPKVQTFQLKSMTSPPDSSAPEVTFWGSMGTSTLDQIKKWIDATNPGSVKVAGLYYSRAETLLNGFAADLKTKATELAGHYTGPAAVETQKQLQALHASVRELARKLGEMGRPLQGYAETLHWAQANVVDSMDHDSRSDRDVDWAGRVPFYRLYRGDKRAADHLKKVNERIVEHYNAMPPDVQQALPDPGVPEIPDFRSGNGTVPGPPNLGGDGVPANYANAAFNPGSPPDGPGGHPTGVPGVGDGPAGSYPSAPGGPGTGFNGADNPYSGADPSDLTGTTLGQPPGAPSASTSAPSAPGNRTTDLAGYDPSLSTVPNSAYPATTPAPGSGPGVNGPGTMGVFPGPGSSSAGSAAMANAARAGTAGAGSLGSSMMGGVPAGRGGAGEEQRDRESTTWLDEDDDVWGGPEGTTPGTLT
ncbi:MAG: hypothetical protein HOV96_23590 [Nonomuraea sp.]|nr:hypothetical protein [Nonomuraea sp.]